MLPELEEGWFLPIRRGDMIRINGFYFYHLGITLHPLADVIAGAKVDEIFLELYRAQMALEAVLTSKIIPVRTCRGHGWELHETISSLLGQYNQGKELNALEASRLSTNIREFETVFSAELNELDLYMVSRKALYSTTDLIENAELIFTDSVRDKIPQAVINDIRQAGKCLAFEVPTAAAFHILRATESVIRLYYTVVVGVVPKVKMRNWGVYISNLRDADADEKILAALDQVRELHRNPVFHPEEALSLDQAITLFNLAQAVMVSMVMDIEKREARPLAVPVGFAQE